jgi:hypothetical protein
MAPVEALKATRSALNGPPPVGVAAAAANTADPSGRRDGETEAPSLHALVGHPELPAMGWERGPYERARRGCPVDTGAAGSR